MLHKNHNLGLEVPTDTARDAESFPTSSCLDDGHGPRPTASLVEIKGYRRKMPAKEVHDGHLLGAWGEPPRHAWPLGAAEFIDVYQIESISRPRSKSSTR